MNRILKISGIVASGLVVGAMATRYLSFIGASRLKFLNKGTSDAPTKKQFYNNPQEKDPEDCFI